ncbi:ABC transporter-like protein [Tolypothrix tenuis PCC 7101]|uniref:ABC transporter-like protein n=1 Tax=Tolypothrix tenuis PCC 7101 TaxID=231146 RepID=A0A1Z4N7Z7_9CYAN|nr:ABC transporter ATP-binding protein [Aulosira sp. FACHB-113]BAZ01849.1 ABC transporter-like protein [Tolypothrix tenuis PCC 7101]BAZ74226.1 ABC transporter-like protein [Aulosira laxa NIES-50]
MSDTVIQVKNLSKKYIIGHQQQEHYTALRDVIAHGTKNLIKSFKNQNSNVNNYQEDFWALQDVSFEIKQGDRVGIIGRNGAGKSTLLKILSRITEPTKGRINIKGRVASLLEVGTGFHPELTGRENIFLNGAILGMSKVEIQRKFDEIVAFAEVEKFLDTPVKRYSSGMYVRLAFAVAAHLEPEILVVDEVLAVGDAQFQKKCLGKMEDVAENQGRTVLFVSHNMNALSTLCQSAILIEKGQIKYQGNVFDAIEKYLVSYSVDDSKEISQYRLNKNLKDIYFKSVEMISGNTQVLFKETIGFEISILAEKKIENISIGGTIFNSMGNPIGAFVSNVVAVEPKKITTIKLEIAKLNLSPGMYYMGFSIGEGNFMNTSRIDYDIIIGYPRFEILPFNEQENIGVWNPAWGNIVLNECLVETLAFIQ